MGRNVSQNMSSAPMEVTQHSGVSAKADDRLKEILGVTKTLWPWKKQCVVFLSSFIIK